MQPCGAVDHSPEHAAGDAEPSSAMTRLLEQVELPTRRASLVLASGRSIEVETADTHDHLVVHARDGRIVLDVEFTESGPRLRFHGADVQLSATRRVAIAAEEIAIEAANNLSFSSGGNLNTHVSGDRHTRVDGDERMEAAAIELQSNDKEIALRAMRAVAIDAERIGLNDDPCPKPFAWSAAADHGGERG